jgi:hypothetical protein
LSVVAADNRLLLVVDPSLSQTDLEDCRRACGSLADLLDEHVDLAVADTFTWPGDE